jgi:hypothetical protein
MGNSTLKVRSSPALYKRQETEDVANPLHFLLTVSVFSTNRAILSHGGMKPNFIQNEKGTFKEPPAFKRLQ